MKLLAVLLFGILTTIAGVHVYWAFGGVWPAQTVPELVKTVVGAPNQAQMPSQTITLIVAALIFIAGVIALATGSVIFSKAHNAIAGWIIRLGAAGLAFIFLARGIAGYVVTQEVWVRVEPFATYDRLLYSPLCLLIGAGFIILLFGSLTK